MFTGHFEMETTHDVINLAQPNSEMISVDLKDAFYSVPLRNENRKYLKLNLSNPHQFTAMQNEYSYAVRSFTKIPKPQFTF